MVWKFTIRGSAYEPVVGTAHPFGQYNSKYRTAWGKFFEKWSRRAITLLIFTLLALLSLVIAPILFPFALAIDLYRQNGMPLIRIIGFFLVYLFAEMLAAW